MERTGPLTHLRIVELGSFYAGPFCGQLFADFGSEVIKIENPNGGDPMREWGRIHADNGQGLWWSVVGRGKKSITLDLKSDDGLAAARELIAASDVLVENFRPGVLERLGLAPEELHGLNPRLVVVRISGYGQTGVHRDRGGFGAVAECYGGLRYVTGHPDRPPVRVGISLGDALSGVFGALGAIAALVEREQSGLGQVVDLGIYEAVLAIMEAAVAEASVGGMARERTGTSLPGVVPNNLYPTSDRRWIAVAGNADRVFVRLAEAIGRPDLARDRRFATHASRGRHGDELDRIIEEWTRARTLAEIEETLASCGVPVSPVNSTLDLLGEQHIRDRGMLTTIADPVFGEVTMQSPVPSFSRTPATVDSHAPALGEHTEEVLRRLLRGQVDELAAAASRGDGTAASPGGPPASGGTGEAG